MKSIILASVPVHGHVAPLLTIARHLVARGDRVRFVTGARFAEAVHATGAHHLPLPAESDFDDRIDVNLRFPTRAGLKGVSSIAFDVEHIFVRPAKGGHDAVLAAHDTEPADAIVTDPAFAGGAFLTSHARTRRPPIVVAGVIPLSLVSRDTAPFGMGLAPARFFNRLRNRLLAAVVDRAVMARAQAVADALHREIHGTSMPGRVLDWARAADGIGQFTVPEFEYPRSDAPASLHFLGPVLAAGSATPLPDWWSEVDGPRPVVHVTQGTIANKDFSQLIGPALQGLAQENVLVVVSTGGRPLAELPPLPENARAAQFLPYDELLPRASVYVTNGGYGGVHFALRHGVPIVVTGGQEDKPEVGARVAWSGVGYRFKEQTPTPAALRRAVRTVLDDKRYRVSAEKLAARMSQTPGVAGLAALVDQVAA